jgi:hypothetical protein
LPDRREVEDAGRQRRQTTEIVQRYTELRLASFDYLQNRNERARAQWHAVSKRIDGLIAANHFLEPSTRPFWPACAPDGRRAAPLAS